MAINTPNIKPACTYPVATGNSGKGNMGSSTGGNAKPTQRPSNK